MTDLIGLSINQYRLEKLLGDGGMGTVYMADDTNLERTVAIKLMHPHFARQEEFRERLKQEARTAAQLEHPSIVRVYDFGESDSGLYIAMEYVSGGSLRAHLQRLQKHGRFLPLDQALQIGIQIADALHYAHNSRDEMIVHRDVKPGNIILKPLDQPEEEGEYAFRAMLTDFGLVKVTNSALQTQTGLTMGTPIYMSPEQCQGADLDGRSDLYSLAAVLYELLTNRPPFMFKSLSDALAIHLRGEMPEPPSVHRGDIPPLVDTILLRLLSKEKEKRFSSGQELANTLRSTLFSLSDSPTRVIRQGTADSNTMSLAAEVAPPGYFIQIESDNRTANYMPLTEPIITIGRGATNDMVLPAEGVSRHHSRLQATQTGWAIVDLGGVNGTFLDGRRLRPNDPVEIPVNGRVQVGPYLLTLQHRPSVEQITTQPPILAPTSKPAIPVYEQQTQPPIQIDAADLASQPAVSAEPEKEKEEEEEDPLGLFLTRERLTTEPGQAATLNVEVVNRTARPDRVSLRLQGLNSQWYEYTDTFVDVEPHSSVQFAIDIQPPRRPDTPVGRQRFRVEVVSQQHSHIDLAANVSLLLTSYTAFNADIEPHSITLPAPISIQLHNQGNTAQTFRAGLDSDETRLRVRGELPTIRLEPGQQGELTLELEPARTQIFGNAYTQDYDVKVVTQEGERKTLSGEASFKPLLSMGLGYVLGIFMFLAVLAMCVTFAVRSVGNSFSGLFGGEEPTPGFTFNTATPTFDPQGATATTQAGTATAVYSATIGAITPSPTTDLADRDNDGLSDSNEAIVGTDLDNPDTDGDGLSDGVEALDLGTNPLSADTDGDILRDGDEVNLYKTDPKNPDTDGDGINDGTEISQGQNPLEGVVATTETAVPTTAESATETPEAATVTPISAATETPVPAAATETTVPAAATETAVPATETSVPATETTVPATETSIPATETSEPTAETPTETAVPVEEPTAEATTDGSSALAFALRCASQPPILDGRASLSEWGGIPLHTLESETDPNRLIEIYALRDASNLYFAFVIEGHEGNITESVRLYIDTTADGGDPDISDRSWQSIRDGSQTVWAGIGTTNDGQTWEEVVAENTGWTSVVNGLNERQWIIEAQIPLGSELPLLSDPFNMALQIAYADEALLWPDTLEAINATTWQAISNPTCS